MLYTTSKSSIYCYPNSEILINKFNIKDQDILTNLETDLTFHRLAELSAKPITGDFGLKHLMKIHKYIFGDIFPFAGKTRNENIIKGDTKFCSCEYIYDNFNILYDSLKSEKFLRDLSKEDFSKRLAYYFSELNLIHPFREGNGRTIREYIRYLALYNNYIINWDKIDKNSLLEAIILSVEKKYDLLIKCLNDAI